MSTYDYDKYINKSHKLNRDNQSVGDDRVDFAGDYSTACADVASGFCAVDSYNAFTAASCIDGCSANISATECGAANCNALSGVNCEASNCKYHHPGGQCSATNITVEAPGADKKKDTYCNTFKSL